MNLRVFDFSVIQVTRETHEPPVSAQQRIVRAGGANRYGEPNSRVVWGGSLLTWIGGRCNLIGATQSITVRIRYEKVLPLLTLGTDPVQIRAATDSPAFATAALAARS